MRETSSSGSESEISYAPRRYREDLRERKLPSLDPDTKAGLGTRRSSDTEQQRRRTSDREPQAKKPKLEATIFNVDRWYAPSLHQVRSDNLKWEIVCDLDPDLESSICASAGGLLSFEDNDGNVRICNTDTLIFSRLPSIKGVDWSNSGPNDIPFSFYHHMTASDGKLQRLVCLKFKEDGVLLKDMDNFTCHVYDGVLGSWKTSFVQLNKEQGQGSCIAHVDFNGNLFSSVVVEGSIVYFITCSCTNPKALKIYPGDFKFRLMAWDMSTERLKWLASWRDLLGIDQTCLMLQAQENSAAFQMSPKLVFCDGNLFLIGLVFNTCRPLIREKTEVSDEGSVPVGWAKIPNGPLFHIKIIYFNFNEKKWHDFEHAPAPLQSLPRIQDYPSIQATCLGNTKKILVNLYQGAGFVYDIEANCWCTLPPTPGVCKRMLT